MVRYKHSAQEMATVQHMLARIHRDVRTLVKTIAIKYVSYHMPKRGSSDSGLRLCAYALCWLFVERQAQLDQRTIIRAVVKFSLITVAARVVIRSPSSKCCNGCQPVELTPSASFTRPSRIAGCFQVTRISDKYRTLLRLRGGLRGRLVSFPEDYRCVTAGKDHREP
jgi:hypothetical protein